MNIVTIIIILAEFLAVKSTLIINITDTSWLPFLIMAEKQPGQSYGVISLTNYSS